MKKILGIITLIVIFFFRDFIMGFLLGSARKKYNETLDKDVELRKTIDDANGEADDLRKKANDLKPKQVDENWHLKGKK